MTIKQVQNLLQYLGYYDGKIDGIWGNGCKTAAKEFQKDNGLTQDGYIGTQSTPKLIEAVTKSKFKTQTSTQVTTNSSTTTNSSSSTQSNLANIWTNKYFTKDEFKCKCGGKYCNGYYNQPNETLVRAAIKLREHFNAPVTISSGLRCPTHNANEGGVSNSRHILGKAMDFKVQGKTSAQVVSWIKSNLPEIRYTYSINSNYTHMDVN